MPGIERDEARLNNYVAKLRGDIGTLRETPLAGLKGEVERMTDRLPDPAQGALDKLRDALAGRVGQTRGTGSRGSEQ